MCFELAKFFELFSYFHFMQKIEFFSSHDSITIRHRSILQALILTRLHRALRRQIPKFDRLSHLGDLDFSIELDTLMKHIHGIIAR
jgi:hypothetical protein